MSFHQIDDDILLAYADGALDQSRRAEIAALLEDAPELQDELDVLLDLQRGLRSTFDAADLLPAPGSATWASISRRTTRSRWHPIAVAIGAGASALLMVALMLLSGQARQLITAIRPTSAIAQAPSPGSYAQTSIPASVSSTAEPSDSRFIAPTLMPSPVPIGPLPDGRIAFAIMRDPIADGDCGRLGVYVIDARASKPTYVADGCNPVLSPDRTHVVYLRGGHIFVNDVGGADSSPEINITGADLFGERPAWSSDSRKIAFSGNRGDRSEIYVVDADGNHLTQITHSTTSLDSGRLGIDPIWSPDGERIAFTVSPALPQADANWDVYVVNADGSHMMRLTNDPARDELIGWTPDGRQILFSSERSGRSETYIMHADGKQQTSFFQLCGYPIWSPDRSRIACDRDGQLFIVNADGSHQTRLARELGNIFNPVWSPDGQYIVFGSFSADWQLGAIYVVRADGTHLTRLIGVEKFLQWVQR
jgi:Tol biopolymer transport system component